jgi:hypothetical protein
LLAFFSHAVLYCWCCIHHFQVKSSHSPLGSSAWCASDQCAACTGPDGLKDGKHQIWAAENLLQFTPLVTGALRPVAGELQTPPK